VYVLWELLLDLVGGIATRRRWWPVLVSMATTLLVFALVAAATR
jgi:hypothetical protein